MRAAPDFLSAWKRFARRRATLFVLAILLVAPWTAQAAQKRVALIIGNGAYAYAPQLDNPANDARLVAATVKQLGFTLIGGGAQIDLDLRSLVSVIREFGRTIGPDTVAMFYYSGHGLQIRGANYLVPVSAKLATPADVDFELVDVDIIERQMEDAHSSLNLIILDACRNNPFGGRGLRDSTGGLAEMHAPTGTLISYAAQPGGVARDGEPGGDSPYTVALTSALKLRGVDVLNAFNQVGVMVRAATNNQQTPWVSSSPIDGTFYLGGDPAAAPPPPPPPAAPPPAAPPQQQALLTDREALFWDSIRNTGRPAELQEYLRQFPNGTFADLARMRLAMLQPNVPPPTALPNSPAGIGPPQVNGPQTNGADNSAPPPTDTAPQSNAPAPLAPAAAPITAAEITEAQRLLAGLGISRAGVDGRGGPRTTEAIKTFQRSIGLGADGELTQTLLASLRAVVPPPSARATALVAMADEAMRGGRTGDAAALYDEALRLDPHNDDAARALAAMRRQREEQEAAHREQRPAPVPVVAQPPRVVPPPQPAPQRGRTVSVPTPVAPAPAPITIAPPAPSSGVAAVAMDAHGRRYTANSDSEGGAVTSALGQCHSGSPGVTCRIVSMVRAAH
jgi:peptidoglycan hydrolase-like protein with peptidoglycan-binding domain